MKKRDLYFAIVLLSVVGYAASVRMRKNQEIASRSIQISQTEFVPTSTINQKYGEIGNSDSVTLVNTPKSERLKSSGLINK